MKRIVLTPTFRPHFPFNRDWLASLDAHAEDLDDFEAHFVVSKAELDDVHALVAEWPRVRTKVHAFEDLLAESGYEVPTADLLREVGKFAFQCLKKLLALKHLDYDQALIIDSESLLLKPTRVTDAFESFYRDPFVCWSTLDHRNEHWYGHLGDTVNRNAGRLLGVPYPKMHLLEYYGWFYDKRIVADMFAALPADLLAAVRGLGPDKSIFECVLYDTFLFHHQERYGHRFVSVNELLRDYLGDEAYGAYLSNFGGVWEQVGIFEYVSKEVTESNLPQLVHLFNDKGMQFYRSEIFNRNERAQERLIDETPITFLVSSENYRRIRERIAVCLSGAPRDPRSGVKGLRDLLEDTTVDVFAHFWDSPDRDVLLQTLQPVGVSFGEDLEQPERGLESVDIAAAERRERLVPQSRDPQALASLYSRWRAGELRRAHEEAEGFRYDLVVAVDGDLLPLEGLAGVLDGIRHQQYGFESVVYVPTAGQGVGLEATIAVADARSADVLSKTWLSVPAALAGYFQPELLQLQNLLAHGIDVRSFELQHIPLRADQPLTTTAVAAALARLQRARAVAGLPEDRGVWLGPDHFRVKANSAATVADLGLETPKVFRLRATDGYLAVGSDGARLGLVTQADDSADFYVVAAADADRTAVNLRARRLVGSPQQPAAAANVAPDRQGVLRVDALAVAEAAFQLDRKADGTVALRWRAGDWRTPTSKDDVHDPLSWWLAVEAGRPVLTTDAGADTDFWLERVHDPEGEAAAMGVTLAVDTSASTATERPLSRLTWRIYTAARVYDEGGMERLVRDTRVFARKFATARRRGRRRTG